MWAAGVVPCSGEGRNPNCLPELQDPLPGVAQATQGVEEGWFLPIFGPVPDAGIKSALQVMPLYLCENTELPNS